MGVSKLSGGLRIALGLGIVGLALGAGVLQRSPWILPFIAAGFTAAYRFGQLRTWRVARTGGKLRQYWMTLPADFLVQLVLVSVLYLIGFGASALIIQDARIAPFAPGDAIWPLAGGAIASILGLYIDRIEGHPVSLLPDWLGKSDDKTDAGGADLRIVPEPVTVLSFYDRSLATADGGDDADESAGLSEDDITRVEARLGRALPDLLIALYRQQDGGNVGELCIPKPGVSDPALYEHVLTPFGGYNDLIPASNLRTVWESVTDYADPANPDEADQFPDGCRAMIVLAQWYRETLFLDYNQPGAPRVGFCDFDRFDTDGRREPITWWPDFESFFACLRRYEPV